MVNHRYHGLGLDGMIGYYGNPKMFQKVTLVTFFDIQDQEILTRQKRLVSVCTKPPVIIGLVIASIVLYSAVKAGIYTDLLGNLEMVGLSTLVGEFVMLGLCLYLCRGWFSFTRWVRKYDAHIVSMLMGGRRDTGELPGYDRLIGTIRGEAPGVCERDR